MFLLKRHSKVRDSVLFSIKKKSEDVVRPTSHQNIRFDNAREVTQKNMKIKF